MNRSEQHHQQKDKEREQKKKEEKEYERQEEKNSWLPIHPMWVVVVGIVLTIAAVVVWTTRLW